MTPIVPMIDASMNDYMRIVTDCLRSILVHLLPVLAGITPPQLLRENCKAHLAKRVQADKDHLLDILATTCQPNLVPQRLSSWRPFIHQVVAHCSYIFNLQDGWIS